MLLAINKAHSGLNLEALTQKVSETYQESVVGVFPLSEDFAQLASEGVFCVKYPDHPLTQQFKKVAQAIIDGP